MRKPSVYTCDVCGIEKGEPNHWFAIVPYTGVFFTYGWEGGLTGNAKARDNATSIHICGQQCLGKKVAELSERLAA